ncbi:MAG TPA: FkbM family methyltransferase [Mucilaginibacter sp.]|jgi:FkbM family methyltransferase|nr:FkbM family methyltransferase [Mucilaginibacter sp.]
MNLVHFLHRFKFLRRLAKALAGNVVLKQKFRDGYIFLNAVDHSWAWTGKLNYNTFDAGLQNYIYKVSTNYACFVDIGSNIGVMTIGTLLENKQIKALAIDANADAIKLLKKSLKHNKLADRCEVINAVVGNADGSIKFDGTGSVIGHVSENGIDTPLLSLAGILNRFNHQKTLVKIDVEGYETQFINELTKVNHLENFEILIELHPLNFNEIGDPEYVLAAVKKLNATIKDLHGNDIASVQKDAFTQMVIKFN